MKRQGARIRSNDRYAKSFFSFFVVSIPIFVTIFVSRSARGNVSTFTYTHARSNCDAFYSIIYENRFRNSKSRSKTKAPTSFSAKLIKWRYHFLLLRFSDTRGICSLYRTRILELSGVWPSQWNCRIPSRWVNFAISFSLCFKTT